MWILISPLELLSSVFPHVIVLQRTVSFKFCLHLHTVYVRIIYEKTKGQIPLRPSLGKQNIQAIEVYYISNI